LHDDIVEARAAARSFRDLFLDVLLAREETHDRLAGHLLDLCWQRDFERIRKRDQNHFTDLTDRKNEMLLTKFLRDPLKCFRGDLKPRYVERREVQRTRLGHEALKRADLEIVLQQLVERVAIEIIRARRECVALLAVEPTHVNELGDDLKLDFSERHGCYFAATASSGAAPLAANSVANFSR
jgi:hypothetical protein